MKKKDIKVGVTIGLVILAMIFMNQMDLLSILSGSIELSITNENRGLDFWTMSQIPGGAYVDSPFGNVLTIREPRGVYTYHQMILKKYADINSEARKFFNKYEFLEEESSPGFLRYNFTGGTENVKQIFGYSTNIIQGSDQMVQIYMLGFTQEMLGDQVIVIEGKDEDGNKFKTYGFGDVYSTRFNPIDPIINSTGQVLDAELIEIYFKKGGFASGDLCFSLGLGCIDIEVFRLENNECTKRTIPELDRTKNDYDTLEECSEHIRDNVSLVLLLLVVVGVIILGLALLLRKLWRLK